MTNFTPPVDATDVLTYKNVRLFVAQNPEQYRAKMRPTFYGYGVDAKGRVLRLGYGGAVGASAKLFVEPGQALLAVKKAVDEYVNKYDYPYFDYRGFGIKLVKWPQSKTLGVATGFDIELNVEGLDASTDVSVLNLLRDKIDRYISYGLIEDVESQPKVEEVLDLRDIGGGEHALPRAAIRDIIDYAVAKAELKIGPDFVSSGTTGAADIAAAAAETMRSAGLNPDADGAFLGLTEDEVAERKEEHRRQAAEPVQLRRCGPRPDVDDTEIREAIERLKAKIVTLPGFSFIKRDEESSEEEE